MSEVKKALMILKQFCYSHERCGSCPFAEFREDMGFICYVNKIVDDERFVGAVNDPDECMTCKWKIICDRTISSWATCPGFEKDLTVTVTPPTIDYKWEEFDDDM